jgi:tetratricopeptide (TPR) repeat protein
MPTRGDLVVRELMSGNVGLRLNHLENPIYMSRAKKVLGVCLLLLVASTSLLAAKLDVEARDLNGQDVRLYGGLVQSGVLVNKSTGNARSAGIEEGDVIVAINGHQVHGIFDMEEILGSIRGLRFQVNVKRVLRQGLLSLENHEFKIESAVDLQIQKAHSIELGAEATVVSGRFRGKSLLLWHANRVLVYDRKHDREQMTSLLKVYSISEHKTYRYPVPGKVMESGFLTDDGLIYYLSNNEKSATLGIVDIDTGEVRADWFFELPALKEYAWDIKLKDVNGDEIPELFYSFNNTLTCLDGITGNTVWYRSDLKTFLMDERKMEELDYSDIAVDDFSQDGVQEVVVGPLLLNAATGEKVGYLSFDPIRHQNGILQCRQIIGDPIPDIITSNGLYDGNSGERVWQPLRSRNFFLADLNGDFVPEIVYLLSDEKLHVHDVESHKELYSMPLEGFRDLELADFNGDGFSDILVRENRVAHLYQTNIPVDHAVVENDRGIGYAASLLDFGLKKDKFFVFARELYQKQKYSESVPLFLRALSDTDDQKQKERYVSIIRYLSSAFMQTGNVEGALGLLKQKQGNLAREVLKDFSSEIVAYLLDRNETWQAIHFLEMSNDDDPLLLARCYLAVGRPEVTVKLLNELENKPTEAQLLLGRAYVLMNQPIAGRVAFKSFLKYFPTSAEGWRELGLLEASEQGWEDAEEALRICLDLDPIQGHLALSSFYLIDSPKLSLEESLGQARSAHRLEASSRTRLQLAESLVENHQYREASRLLGKVKDPGLEFNRFEKLTQRCMYQIQAEDKYEEAEKLLLSPVFKKRNFLSAKDLLNEIIDRYPKSLMVPMAHFRLGEIFLDPEHRDESKAVFHFARVAESGHFLTDKARSRLRLLESNRTIEDMGREVLQIETESLMEDDRRRDELEAPAKPVKVKAPEFKPRAPKAFEKRMESLDQPKEEVKKGPKAEEAPFSEGGSRRGSSDEKEDSTFIPGLRLEGVEERPAP